MRGEDLEYKTLVGTYTGAAASIYPNLALMTNSSGQPAQITWDFAVFVTAIQLSTSLTIFPDGGGTPGDTGGIIVTVGKQTAGNIAIGEGLSSVIDHITAPNSIAGPPAFALPSSKVSEKTFRGCGKYMPAGAPVSLYAFANTNAAGNFLFAIASIEYIRAP